MPKLDQVIDWASPFSTYQATKEQCCEAGFATQDQSSPLLGSCDKRTTYTYSNDICRISIDFVDWINIQNVINTGVLDEQRDDSECCQAGLDSNDASLILACQ